MIAQHIMPFGYTLGVRIPEMIVVNTAQQGFLTPFGMTGEALGMTGSEIAIFPSYGRVASKGFPSWAQMVWMAFLPEAAAMLTVPPGSTHWPAM